VLQARLVVGELRALLALLEHKEHLEQVVLLEQRVQAEQVVLLEQRVQAELLVLAVLVELAEWVDQ
jgi:hypothetical protein